MVHTGVQGARPVPLHLHGKERRRKGKSVQIYIELFQSSGSKRLPDDLSQTRTQQVHQRVSRLAEKIWEALNEISADSLLSEGRVYGGGLHELEPKELANTNAEKMVQSVPKLVQCLEKEDYDLFTSSCTTAMVHENRSRKKSSRLQRNGGKGKRKLF